MGEPITDAEVRRRAGITWVPFAAATALAAVIVGVVILINFFGDSPVRHPFAPGWSIVLTAPGESSDTVTTVLVDPQGNRQRLDRVPGVTDATVIGWSSDHRLAAIAFHGSGKVYVHLYELTDNHISSIELPADARPLRFRGERLLVQVGSRLREYDRLGHRLATMPPGPATGTVTTSVHGTRVTVSGGTEFTVRRASSGSPATRTVALPAGTSTCRPVRPWRGPDVLAECDGRTLWTIPLDGATSTQIARPAAAGAPGLLTAWRVHGSLYAAQQSSCPNQLQIARVGTDGTAQPVRIPVNEPRLAGVTGDAFYLVSNAGTCHSTHVSRGSFERWIPGRAPTTLLGGATSDDFVIDAATIGQP